MSDMKGDLLCNCIEELDELRAAFRESHKQFISVDTENQALRTENEKLRAALKPFADDATWVEVDLLQIENKEQRREIEKLRAERDECERQLQDSFSKMGAILEERNVLRAALKPITDIGLTEARKVGLWSPKSVITMYVNYENISAAAAALKETGDE